jgi:transcription elongation GreA/GreB family factor
VGIHSFPEVGPFRFWLFSNVVPHVRFERHNLSIFMSDLSLSPEDLSTLQAMLDATTRRVAPQEAEKLRFLIQQSSPSDSWQDRAGLSDRVSLVCPSDPSDTYEFTLALPGEENVDEDRIPITAPICLAALGRHKGDVISWETARGTREMRIEKIEKLPVAVS